MRYAPNKIADKWYVSDSQISISFLSLVLNPKPYATADIVKRFVDGKPLTPDQFHYLDWHRSELSNKMFDPILDYFLKSQNKNDKKHDPSTAIFMSDEILNKKNIALLKKRINEMLKEKENQQVNVELTPKQFEDFKHYTTQDLIYWHGNQLLTGAPFYPGSTPAIIHVQWGNYYGIVKQHVIAGEKAGTGNFLLTFEKRNERNLAECVEEYKKHIAEEKKSVEKSTMSSRLPLST